ncbi:MAG: exodeoxyribonuclease VII small subunit [Lachnospiraceae bacterium]|nr:exodeoxyribonuclease VII small subunit [Lachnospiraceae bacterium]
MSGFEEENVNASGEELSVEQSFDRLDEMVKALESEDIPLEESFRLYQEGMKLLKSVGEKLDGYEKKMLMISEDGVVEEFE